MADPERTAFWLLKEVNRAVREYAMIRAGDRIALGISGGKDSLALLKLLDLRRRSAPESYELVPIHILADAGGTELPVHTPLQDWCRAQGCELHLERILPEPPDAAPGALTCQRCARRRRQALFTAARRLDCNVLALGHHADDLAATTLMNLVHSGRAETMAPVRSYFDGAFRLIRPLCYLPESDIRRYARQAAFPPPPPPCPLGGLTARAEAAEMLRLAKKASRNALPNLLRAGLRGLAENPDDPNPYLAP